MRALSIAMVSGLALIASTVTMLFLLAATLTPAALSVSGWLLD